MRILAAILLLASCDADETLTGYGAEGTWQLARMNAGAFEAKATITFAVDGRVSGSAPCNSYSTQQSAPYPWFTLGPMMATKRACADLAQEQAYFDALTDMTLVEVSGDVLILSNDDGNSLLFTRLSDG